MTDVVPPSTIRRIAKELNQLRNNPPEGVRVVVDEEDLTAFTALIEGPEGTPYAKGYFRIRFAFGATYPSQPPKCTMMTKIFHPNVSKQGEICVDTLKKGWKPEFGISHVLSVIRCLLIYPNPESALDEEAGKLLLEAYEDYCKHARLFTSIHATPRTTPPEFVDASAASSASAGSTAAPAASAPASVAINTLGPSSSQPQAPMPKASAGTGKPAVKRGLKRL